MDFEKEIAATAAELPDEPQDQVVEKLLQNGMLQKNALVYRVKMAYIPLEERNEKMIRAHCTACGKEMFLEYAKEEAGYWQAKGGQIGFRDPMSGSFVGTGEDCMCPICGGEVTTVHISKIKNHYLIDTKHCVTVHNVRNHLCLLSWIIEKVCTKDGEIGYIAKKQDGAMLVENKMVRITGHMRTMNGYESYFCKWELRKKFRDEIGMCLSENTILFDPEDIYKTEARNSAFEEYIERLSEKNREVYPVAYLQLWARYPNVENLIRQGYESIVNDVIEKCMTNSGYYYNVHTSLNVRNTSKYINWKRARPHQMLGLEKEEMPLAKKYSLEELVFYAFCKTKNIKLDKKTFMRAKEIGPMDLKDLAEKPCNGYSVPVVRLINYITKQREITKKFYLVSCSYIRDYWNMVYKLYGSMEEALLYPKDIVKAHDRMTSLVKEKKKQETDEKIRKRCAQIEFMEFADEETGLLIRPCASHSELIYEGKRLEHCVGTYANSYASGKTNIFFVRHIAEPDEPFFTLEFKDGLVAQNRGFKNRDRTPEVVKFEKKWLEFVKTGGKKNGKYGSRSKASLAGA